MKNLFPIATTSMLLAFCTPLTLQGAEQRESEDETQGYADLPLSFDLGEELKKKKNLTLKNRNTLAKKKLKLTMIDSVEHGTPILSDCSSTFSATDKFQGRQVSTDELATYLNELKGITEREQEMKKVARYQTAAIVLLLGSSYWGRGKVRRGKDERDDKRAAKLHEEHV